MRWHQIKIEHHNTESTYMHVWYIEFFHETIEEQWFDTPDCKVPPPRPLASHFPSFFAYHTYVLVCTTVPGTYMCK